MILPHIQDLVAVCAAHGVKYAILSPGSRSAPISLAFNAHPDIDTKIIPDERSAAFVAMGMAQQFNEVVVLVCTSGSASLNYAPAIAEAFYQEIPIIVITADRPPEWVNQYDGQTIQQHGIYGKHAKAYFELPVSVEHSDALWHSNRIVNEAILKATEQVQGPVHINVPLREPFYPEANDSYNFSAAKIIKRARVDHTISEEQKEELLKTWRNAKTRWIVVGQNTPSLELTEILKKLSGQAIIINEVTGNQHMLDKAVTNQDLLFQKGNWHKITPPDLLITLGNSLISKNLKLFLRSNHSKTHWHTKDTDRINDIGQQLSQVVEAKPEQVLGLFIGESRGTDDALYALDKAVAQQKVKYLEDVEFGELKATDMVLKSSPDNCNIQIANSMAVRYANFIGIKGKGKRIDCNRGTSGIDGSNSTAVGAAIASGQLTLLITGDLAFFYDRNAFWNNEDLSNLRIVILNNDGGGIFNMIPGPTQQPDHAKIFLTPHGLTAKSLANEFGFGYTACSNEENLNQVLIDFFKPTTKSQIIEVFSDMERNTEIFNLLKSITILD